MNKRHPKRFYTNRTDDRDCNYWHSRSSRIAGLSKLYPKAKFSEVVSQ